MQPPDDLGIGRHRLAHGGLGIVGMLQVPLFVGVQAEQQEASLRHLVRLPKREGFFLALICAVGIDH